MSSNVTSTHAEFLADCRSNMRQSGKDNSQSSQYEMSERKKILKTGGVVTSPPIKIFPKVSVSLPSKQPSVKQPSVQLQPPNQLDSVTEKLMKKSADDLLPRSAMIDYRTRSQLASLGLLSSLPLPQTSPRKESGRIKVSLNALKKNFKLTNF